MSLCSVPGCGKPSRTSGLCGMHYYRRVRGYQGRSPRLGRRVSHEEVAAFVAEAVQHDRDACLLWPFGRAKAGYGSGWYEGRRVAMHRLICELVHGPVPSSGYVAAHVCGNATCVAPRHLRWATLRQVHRRAAGRHGGPPRLIWTTKFRFDWRVTR